MDTETLWIGNDHGGYDLKLQIMDHLEKKYNIAAHNVGADTSEIVRYPHYAARVAEAVARRAANEGVARNPTKKLQEAVAAAMWEPAYPVVEVS